MSILKAAAATEKNIKKILSDRVTESADLETQIEIDEGKIKKATEAMEAASDASNLEAYKEAKRKMTEAETELEMHKRRLEKLKEKELISKADYEKNVADIFSDYEKARRQTRQKLLRLTEEMKKETDDFLEAYSHANKTLARLQDEVYRNADRMKVKNGFIDRPKALPQESTFYWGNLAVDCKEYETAKREAEEAEA